MANMTRRDEGGGQSQRAGSRPLWNPFAMFAVWPDPFSALIAAAPAKKFIPAFDFRETKDGYVIEADLPGVRERDIEISMSGNQLRISGRRQSVRREENEKYSCSERAYGTFERTFALS